MTWSVKPVWASSNDFTPIFVNIWSRWLPRLCVILPSASTGVSNRFLYIYSILIIHSLKFPDSTILEPGRRSRMSDKMFSRSVIVWMAFALFWGSKYTVITCTGTKLNATDFQLIEFRIYLMFFTLWAALVQAERHPSCSIIFCLNCFPVCKINVTIQFCLY